MSQCRFHKLWELSDSLFGRHLHQIKTVSEAAMCLSVILLSVKCASHEGTNTRVARNCYVVLRNDRQPRVAP